MPTKTESPISFGAIFERLGNPDKPLTARQARHILTVRFSDRDVLRMRDLLERNRESQLKPDEIREMDRLIYLGDVIAILQSQARKILKRPLPKRIHG